VGKGAGRVIAGTAAIVASAVIPGTQGWLTGAGMWLVAGAVHDPLVRAISLKRSLPNDDDLCRVCNLAAHHTGGSSTWGGI
jgi:type IV secretory pathway TrbD component